MCRNRFLGLLFFLSCFSIQAEASLTLINKSNEAVQVQVYLNKKAAFWKTLDLDVNQNALFGFGDLMLPQGSYISRIKFICSDVQYILENCEHKNSMFAREKNKLYEICSLYDLSDLGTRYLDRSEKFLQLNRSAVYADTIYGSFSLQPCPLEEGDTWPLIDG